MPPPSSPQAWSNEKSLQLLELRETEPVIWNPNHKLHKLKHKVHDAWNRISAVMDNTSIEELKSKKKSLMATFRSLLKKKRTSMCSGAGQDEVHQPIWFAFDVMERYLAQIYEVDKTMDTENDVETLNSEASQPPTPSQRQQNVDSSHSSPSQEDAEITASPSPSVSGLSQPNRKKLTATKKSCLDDAQTKISHTLDTLSHVLREKRNPPTTVEDECDMYAKLLAKRLRKYPDYMQRKLMYQIDGFLLQNPYPAEGPPSARSPHSSQSQYSDYQISERSPMTFISQSPQPYVGRPSSAYSSHVTPQNSPVVRRSNSSASQHSEYQKAQSSIHIISQNRVNVRAPSHSSQLQYSEYIPQSPVYVEQQQSIPQSPVYVDQQQSIPQSPVYIEQQQSPVSEFGVQISIPETNDTQDIIKEALWKTQLM